MIFPGRKLTRKALVALQGLVSFWSRFRISGKQMSVNSFTSMLFRLFFFFWLSKCVWQGFWTTIVCFVCLVNKHFWKVLAISKEQEWQIGFESGLARPSNMSQGWREQEGRLNWAKKYSGDENLWLFDSCGIIGNYTFFIEWSWWA